MSQQSDARPVHSQGLLLIAVAVGVLLLAVYLTSSIIENENGGISAAVRTLGIGLALWAFIKPKAGLYIITIEGFSLDYLKKVAVYYGTVSTGTVIEVLAVGMLAVVATVTGLLIQGVALRRFKLAPLQWAVLGVGLLGAVAMLFARREMYGFEKSAENAFNACAYIAIALPMSVYLTDREKLTKLLNLQFFLATAWAIMGIKQYCFGFSLMEWFYAETGLSGVASEHMLKFAVPRPFGFGTGMSNYSMISAYFCYGVWHVLQHRRRRFFFVVCTAIVFGGVLASMQRTTLITPVFVLFFYLALQNMRRAMLVYAASWIVFITGVINAEYIYAHFEDINSFISMKGAWGENVFTVNTYTECLISWMSLKNPATYSPFGLKDQDIFVHDVFTGVLVSYGVVGLLLTVITLSLGAWFVLRTVLRVEDPQDRQFARFGLSIAVAIGALGIVGGGNFTATPVNLVIWTFFSVAICMAVNSHLIPVASKNPSRILEEFLRATGRPPLVQADGANPLKA